MPTLKSWDLKILVTLNAYFAKHSSFNKILAEYLIYFLPVILIVVWFWSKESKKLALRGLFSIILAWPIFSTIIGKLVNRPRPFEVSGVQELLFHRPDYSFPSDHAAALFALAFSFWFSGAKKLALGVFAYALVISFFRVATGIHWPSDILAGIVIGLIAAYTIDLFDKPLNIVYNFILKIAHFLRLA